MHNLAREIHAAEWDVMRAARAGEVPLQMQGLKGFKAAGSQTEEIRTAVHSKFWQRLENVFVLFPGTHECKCILCYHAGLVRSLSTADMPGDTGLWYETGRVWPGCEPGDQQAARGPSQCLTRRNSLTGQVWLACGTCRALGARSSCYCLAEGGMEAQQKGW